jgi:hypothetical protein
MTMYTCPIFMKNLLQDLPMKTKIWVVQIPYIKWFKICVESTHVLLYTLNHSRNVNVYVNSCDITLLGTSDKNKSLYIFSTDEVLF